MASQPDLQNAIRWNLRRRNEARTKGDMASATHFHSNVVTLRERVTHSPEAQ